MNYERGQQAAQTHNLTIKLAKLENVEEQRVGMKERAEAAEFELKNLRSQVSELRQEFRNAQKQLSDANTRLSKAEKCAYLESLAKTSNLHYQAALNWAMPRPTGYASDYFKEASAAHERGQANLTACLTSSGN